MKLLVTGATGFIGGHLLNRFIRENYEFWTIVRPSTKVEPLEKRNIKFYIDDGSMEKLISFMKEEHFTGIVHLASKFLVQHNFNDIDNLLFSNILFPTRLLEASVQTNIDWFINTGTFWQHYENKKYSPLNLYAATKQAFEDVAQFYIETSSINFVTLKINDTFGPDDTRPKIFNLWLKISESGESLDMSPGEQIIEICYIENVIDAYMKLIEHLESKDARKYKRATFAIKVNERLSLKELAKIFEKTTGKQLNINWGGRSYRPREVMVPLKNGKKVPGWRQKISLKEGILKTYESKKRSEIDKI